MDINKLNHVTEVTQVPDTNQNVQGDGSFKFTLASAITDADLQAKVDMLLSDITAQGNRIAQHMDIRDMKKYRGLIREFMNEVVFRSHKFSRENFLDRRGRHRVYGLIKLIDSNLDELAQELVRDKGIDIRYPHLIFFGCGLDKRRTHMAGNLVAEKKT